MTLQEFIEQECELVIQDVCSRNLVSRENFLGPSKALGVVRARRIAIKLLQERGFSHQQIAKAIKRNRTTVYYWSGARFRDRQRQTMREYQERKRQELELYLRDEVTKQIKAETRAA